MRRLSPSIVIGALMFFLGAAVSAGAAKLITSADIKNGTIQLVDISTKARTSLAGATGATGSAGAKGATGAPGGAGAKGDTGATGATGATGTTGAAGATGPQGPQGAGGAAGSAGSNGTPGAAGVSGPAILAGTVGADGGWTSPGGGGNYGSESGAQVPVPADSSYTAKSLIATIAAPAGAGRSVTVTLRLNATDTALTCTIAGDSATSCTPPDGTTAVIPGGSKIALHSVVGGGATTPTVAYAYRAEF
ncbi:MAG: hypothetical protein QOJ89_1285 [bacterium]|jgi:hypothetical protein